jgi:uncharacterized surface protein with fasciclin (FAS1) repeats
MKKFMVLTASILLVGNAIAGHHEEKQDIVDIAAGNEAFSTLVAAVKAAGLVDTL